MNRYLACAAAGAIALFSAPASAQDMDWTGFYVGLTAGYNATDSNSEYINAPFTAWDIPSNQAGMLGGVSAGANVQAGIVVLGVEGTATVGNISTSFPSPVPGSTDVVTTGSDFQALLLGRAGVSVGSFLPYLTAGLAVANAYSVTESGADDSGVFSGLAFGAGVEFALDSNWSIKGQYLRSNLSGANFHQGEVYETQSALVSDTIMLGVNFRF